MTMGFFRARILTHFRAAALGFEPMLPGSLAIVPVSSRLSSRGFFPNGMTALPGVRRICPCCDALFLQCTSVHIAKIRFSESFCCLVLSERVWCNPQGRSLRRQRKGPSETSGTGLDQLTTHRFIKTTAAEAREPGWGGTSAAARSGSCLGGGSRRFAGLASRSLRAYPEIFSRNSRYLKSTEPSGTKRRSSGQASPERL